MIQPTVGRVLHYYEPTWGRDDAGPLAAIICHVHSPDLVNLVVFDRNGTPMQRTSVTIWQGSEPAPSTFTRAEWMPFQKGQVATADTPGGLMDRVAKLEERMRLSRY